VCVCVCVLVCCCVFNLELVLRRPNTSRAISLAEQKFSSSVDILLAPHSIFSPGKLDSQAVEEYLQEMGFTRGLADNKTKKNTKNKPTKTKKRQKRERESEREREIQRERERERERSSLRCRGDVGKSHCNNLRPQKNAYRAVMRRMVMCASSMRMCVRVVFALCLRVVWVCVLCAVCTECPFIS